MTDHPSGIDHQDLSHPSALLYIPSEEKGSPDFLLFEERILNPRWKRASEKSRQLWGRLRDRYEQFTCEVFADDRFLGRLRYLKQITVLLNKPIDPALVRTRLQQMLRDRSFHHLRWLVIDLALLPFSVFVAILPGPNVIGYYLLFRVFSHWKSYRSASRARLDNVEVQVSSRAKEVSALFRRNRDVREVLHELRSRYGLRALQERQFIPQRAFFRQAWARLTSRVNA